MKTIFTLTQSKKNLLPVLLFVALAVLNSCSLVENVTVTERKKAGVLWKDRDVRIYPDIIKRVMHVKNIEVSEVDFFVFDMEGTLIRHLKMPEGDHQKISHLEKGTYVYQVFKGDEMSESGKLKIK